MGEPYTPPLDTYKPVGDTRAVGRASAVGEPIDERKLASGPARHGQGRDLLHLPALRFAPGSLALPPVIDRNGFRFFVKRHKTDHLTETKRLASLAPATLSVSHVGGCF